jgi:hypothetical protein
VFASLKNRVAAGLGALLLLSACYQTAVWALDGYYTEEEVRLPNPEGGPDYLIVRKSWYSGQMMRKDDDWSGITIARFDKSRIYLLTPEIKNYFEISPEALRRNALPQMKLFGAQLDPIGKYYFPDDLFIRTGTTKEIGRWNCYQVMTNPKYRAPESPYMIFWYSSDVDFPVDVFGEQLKNFFGDSEEAKGLFAKLIKFEGYPVRTESHAGDGITVTTLIKLEHRKNIDPALFEVPKDYKAVKLPENAPPPKWGK